jgi:uncharacterized protein (TIRG00374 family)
VLDGLSRVNFVFLTIGLALGAFSILIRSYKWGLLLKVQGAELSLGRLQAVCYMALFFNNFLPGSLGGDITKVYKTARHTNRKTGALSAVLMEKTTNLVSLILMVSAAGMITLKAGEILTRGQLFYVVGSGLVLIVCIWFGIKMVLKYRIYRITISRLKILEKVIERVELVLKSFALYSKYRKTLVLALFLSIIFFFINMGSTFFFAQAVGVTIELEFLVVLIPLIFLLNMLPISFNGIGLQEGGFVYFLGQIGVDSSAAFLVALMIRLAMVIFSLIGVVIYLIESSQMRSEDASSKLPVGYPSQTSTRK